MHEKMYEKAEEIVKIIESETDKDNCIKQVENLQTLGVISPSTMCRKEKNNSISLTGLFYQNGKELAAGLRKHWINSKAEQEVCKAERTYIEENVLIGTEFTFHHEAFQFTLDDLDKNRAGKGINVGNRIIAEWTRDLLEACNYKDPICGLHVIAVNTGEGKKKYENAEYDAVEIEFTIKKLETDRGISWKVNFDLDPSCIEMQTQPMPYQFFENYGYCINELLFNHVSKYGLIADKDITTGGGGHISLDAKTAFDENAIYLRNFLVLYSCEAKKETFKSNFTESQLAKSFLTEEQRQILITSDDEVNAQFVFETIDKWQAFQKFISDSDKTSMNLAGFVQGIHGNVYIHVAEELENLLGEEEVAAVDKPHYQAVNLEHIGVQGRIEMRRFDAQKSIYELLEQLNALFEILRMARTNWKISIDKALESDYFAG